MMGALFAGLAVQGLIVLALGLALWLVHLTLLGRVPEVPSVPAGKLKGVLNSWRSWLGKPGSTLTLAIAFGAIIALCLGIYGQLQDPDTRWREWSVELVSVSFAVLVIDYANRRRAAIEFKQSIIRQMASRSNDFALDAVRLTIQNGWLCDGSLRGVDLSYANLEKAPMGRANLQGTILKRANLQRAGIGYADLRGANMENAELYLASLFGADLRGAFLSTCHLQHAQLARADLRDANLQSAWFHDANLAYANLEGANLEGACLFNAFLPEANLKDANLGCAYLQDANLENAKLQGANLEGAKYSSKTQWPLDFDLRSSGAILDDAETVALALGRKPTGVMTDAI